MLNLTHGQQVQNSTFRYTPKVTIFSVEGYALANGRDPAEAVAREISNGGRLASSIYSGAMITASYSGRDEEIDAKLIAYAAAPFVEEGDEVEIEGRHYIAHIQGEEHSHPIVFLPTKASINAATRP